MTNQEISEAVARKLGWYQLGDGQWADAWHIRTNLLPYATDIAAAWEIVDNVSASYRWDLHKNIGGWIARIGGSEDWSAQADTPAMAICLAFLKLEETK